MTNEENLKELIEEKDSFAVGSASKGGLIKFYCDYNNIAECKKKLDLAVELKKYAQVKLEF